MLTVSIISEMSALMMEAVITSETSVNFYQKTVVFVQAAARTWYLMSAGR
jgi:hypothetical protein